MNFDFWNTQSEIDLKVTQLSTNTTSFNMPRNVSIIEQGIIAAGENNSDLLLTDEMNLVAYDSGDDFQHADNATIYERLMYLAQRAYQANPNMLVTVGNPWRVNLDSLGLDLKDMALRVNDPAQLLKDPLVNRHGLPFNVMTVLGGGRILSMSAKTNLFNDERGYEKRYFPEWATSSPVIKALEGNFGTIKLSLTGDGQNEIPFGQPIIHVKDPRSDARYNFGQLICEMKWVASQYDDMFENDDSYGTFNPLPAYARHLGSKDGLVMAVSNASPPARGKILKHAHLAKLASQFAGVVYDTDGLGTSGSTFAQMGHRLAAKDGRLMHSGSRLDFLDSARSTTITKIKSAPKSTEAKAHVVLERKLTDHFNQAGQPENLFMAYEPANQDSSWDKRDFAGRFEEEEIRMFALWTYDYMAKTKQNGVVQALSGGKDSAFNLTIAVLAMRAAICQKGIKAVMKDFSHLPYQDEILTLAAEKGEKEATSALIKRFATGVTMPTQNSSKETRKAAKDLADGLGVTFYEHNVQDLVNYYALLYAVKDTTKLSDRQRGKLQKEVSSYLNQSKDSVSEEKLAKQAAAIKKKFPAVDKLITAAKDSDIVAYENIQARARQVFIMMYANTESKMALANPNLDEALNAYATFGGDLHSGTININAGEYKHDQVNLMHHMMKNGLHNVQEPMTFLATTLEQIATAELQPRGKKGELLQTDEGAMEASSEQIKAFSEWMFKYRAETQGGGRRLNVEEVYLQARESALFEKHDANSLYSTMRMRYAKWNGGPAQPKVYAGPIAPTTGNNVDKQTSLRTPNISAANRDELTMLGVKLMFKYAKDENDFWANDPAIYELMEHNALYNEAFINDFDSALQNQSTLRFDVQGLYKSVKDNGPQQFFKDTLKAKPKDSAHLDQSLNAITAPKL
jgi:NAD+ synthase (glutamine-hydrolysing)